MDDEWEVRMTRRPDGAHRAKSRDTPGADRELLYDDAGNLLGPTESRTPDVGEIERIYGYDTDPDDDGGGRGLTPGQQAAVEIAGTIITELMREVVGPAIRDHAIPALKQRIAQAAEGRRTKAAQRIQRRNDKQAAIADTAEVASSVVTVDPDQTIIMTADQFREQVLLTMAAEHWLAQQKDRLSRIVVVDETLTPELRDAINLVLEGKSYLLGDATSALLGTYLREAQLVAEAEPEALLAAEPLKKAKKAKNK